MAEYQRGEMDITDQQRTFDGFIAIGVWSSGVTAIVVLFLTLMFATPANWMVSLGATLAAGVATGVALKLNAIYYVVLALLAALVCVIVAFIGLIGAVA